MINISAGTGEGRTVFVKRLVVEETIEEHMLQQQGAKMGTPWSRLMSLQQCQRDQSRASLCPPLTHLVYSCPFLALRYRPPQQRAPYVPQQNEGAYDS
jgi:hypothetical protein